VLVFLKTLCFFKIAENVGQVIVQIRASVPPLVSKYTQAC
jgi:hypothetical protein